LRSEYDDLPQSFSHSKLSRHSGCSCGRHASQSEHENAAAAEAHTVAGAGEDAQFTRVVEAAVMRALFPDDAGRRAFLKAVGATTAAAALAQIFPIAMATEVFAAGGALEKKDLKVGFIPITCATPIIMAHPMGFYTKQGLNVDVVKTAGWAVIRDKTLNKEYDAAHMLSPMPLAITLGTGSAPVPYAMAAVENINGQAITLAMKHKDKRDPKQWKGFKFAVPFDYSMHNYLLRYTCRAWPRPGSGRADPRRAAAGDGGQPARRQSRRLPGARPGEPARSL
jgi:nitrate/nitrite transport system substrate-binding protein